MCPNVFLKIREKKMPPNALFEVRQKTSLEEVKKILKEMSKNKSDINLPNENDWTALMQISGYTNDPVIIQTLIDHGANVNYKNDLILTALSIAVRFTENPEIVKTLLEAGADVNVTDAYGKRILDCARQPKVYKLLNEALNKGANKVNERKSHGRNFE